MPIGRLAHYAVRTRDLGAATAFYVDILGLTPGPRPPFAFPGAWLYPASPRGAEDQGCVHLVAAAESGSGGPDEYLDARDIGPGGGALDHLAFLATDWAAMRQRLSAARVPYTERRIPGSSAIQVFLTDPDGLIVELNYAAEAASEADR